MSDHMTNRWPKYRKANDEFPGARAAEFHALFDTLEIIPGNYVGEFGTGNGQLTMMLAERIGEHGKVYTYDTQVTNLINMKAKNTEGYPIIPTLQADSYSTNEPDELFDRIVSLAALHHYDDKNKQTGTSGREIIFREWSRLLKPDGELIVVDGARNTPPADYFDAIDNPAHCYPDGHPHDFIDEELVRELCSANGLTLASYSVQKTPWEFDSEEQAAYFLHTMHNAQCSEEESLRVAQQHLDSWEEDGKFYMDWELAFVKAVKK